MTDTLSLLSDLGEISLWVYWLPLLVWSVLGALVLGGLRLAGNGHPFFHYTVREALLFTLPIGLLVAGVVGVEATGPAAAARQAVVVFVEPGSPPSAMSAAQPSSPAAPSSSASGSEPPGAYLWIGLVTVAAAVLSLRRLGQLVSETWALRQFRRSLSPTSGRISSQVVRPVQEQLGLSRCDVTYGVAPAGTMPVTFGWARPVVALPEDLLEQKENLRLVLLHELVHVRRRDYLLRWVERLVDVAFAASPLTRYLLKEIGRYRELACDLEVMGETASPRAYASMLAHHLLPTRHGAAGALGMARSVSFIKTRIQEVARYARDAGPRSVPYRASFSVSAAVLALVSGGVFLAACSEQPSVAPPSQHAQHSAQQEILFSNVRLMSVWGDSVYVQGGGQLRSAETGKPLTGAKVYYSAGSETDTATTNADGRFGFDDLPLSVKHLRLTATHEGEMGTYDIDRDVPLGRLARDSRQAFEHRQREMVMEADFRLVPEEIIINGQQIQVPDSPYMGASRLMDTPNAYVILRIPNHGRIVISKAAFAGARKEVVARGHAVTFATDKVDITINTRIPVLRHGGTKRLWGRFDSDPNIGTTVGRAAGTDISTLAKRDSLMREIARKCEGDGEVSEDCVFRDK